MSRADMAMIILIAMVASVPCFGISWWSYYVGKTNQEKVSHIFGSYGSYQRKRLRTSAYVTGILVGVAFIYWGVAQHALIGTGFGIYVLALIAVHRLAYEFGKRAGTDPDAYYE